MRGRTAVTRDGEEFGEVDVLLADDREDRVRFLRIDAGGFLGIGRSHVLVEAVEAVEPGRVRLGRDRAGLSDFPGYDPELADDRARLVATYGRWGYSPFSTSGYVNPPFPVPADPPPRPSDGRSAGSP